MPCVEGGPTSWALQSGSRVGGSMTVRSGRAVDAEIVSCRRRKAMNRIREMVLSGFVAIGFLGLGASPSRAQDRSVNVPTRVVAYRDAVSDFTPRPAQPPAYVAPRQLAPP